MAEAARRVTPGSDLGQVRARLAAAIRRMCPAWLQGQRDDIIQAALLRVTAALERGEGKADLNASYLWRVAYSATIDEIRKARARREAEQRAAEQPGELAAAADQGARRRELASGIVDCLGTLVEARQVAVTLHLQGHSVPEAARLLGWEAKRVENLVYRGLADLRDCLDGKGLAP